MKYNSQECVNINKPLFFESQSDYSSIIEENTGDLAHFKEIGQQDPLGWKALHNEKIELQKLRKQLFGMYVQKRRNLIEVAKEICAETQSQYDLTPMLSKQQAIDKKRLALDELKQVQAEQVNDKLALVEKIISERRIKRYYKSKYEVHFQNQLDPEDDQQQIYQFYSEAFGKMQPVQQYQPITPSMPNIYNQQTRQHHNNSVQNSRAIINFLMPPDNANKVEDSFEKMKYLPSPSQSNAKHFNQTFMGVAHELSFDERNQPQFQNLTQNFIEALNLKQNNDEKKKNNWNKTQESQPLSKQKEEYQDFISRQNQQLHLQRLKVQQLTQKAHRVLINDETNVYQSSVHGEENEQDQKLPQLRYLMGELIQIFTVSECLKHYLKFKSFQLLKKLYQHASEYYREEIVFQEPITVKYMSQIIASVLPQEQQNSIKLILQRLFGVKNNISLQQFIENMSSSINEKQYQMIQSSLIDQANTNILELTIRLFDIWIELEYFQNKVKVILTQHPLVVQKFIEEAVIDGNLNVGMVHQFLYRTKKMTKVRKLKLDIFFRKILGFNLHISSFFPWFETTERPTNKTIQQIKEKEEYDYYYNNY